MKHIVTTSELSPIGDESPTTWQAARSDITGAGGLKVVAVVGLVLWMTFQWGFGNDAMLPWVSAAAFDATDDRSTWSSGLLAVGVTTLAAFMFWAITQAFDAIILLTGLKLIPRLSDRISMFLRKKGWVTPYSEMKWSTRWIVAYATGVSALCLVDLFATGQQGIAHRKKMIFQAVLLSAGSVCTIAGLAAFAAVIAVRVPATASAAETFVRYARNPLTWVAILGTIFLTSHLLDREDKVEERPPESWPEP